MKRARSCISEDKAEGEMQHYASAPLKRPKLVGVPDFRLIPVELVFIANRVPPPWSNANITAVKGSLPRLHAEILAFQSFVIISPAEQSRQNYVLKLITHLTKALWSHAEVKIYGSAATGLNLPNSDLDIVVLAETGRSQTSMLHALLSKLKKSHEFTNLTCIDKARVPVIKMKHRSGLDVDVTVNQPGGVEATALILSYLKRYPEVKPLVLVLKAFLRQVGLNETYGGGVGSYLLFCMAVASVQHCPEKSDQACVKGSLQSSITTTDKEPFKSPTKAETIQQPSSRSPPVLKLFSSPSIIKATSQSQYSKPPSFAPYENKSVDYLNDYIASLQKTQFFGTKPQNNETLSPPKACIPPQICNINEPNKFDSQDKPVCLGILLMHFLKMFSSDFEYETKGLSIEGKGSMFSKKARGWWDRDLGLRLVMECPLDRSQNVGYGAFNIEQVRHAFGLAYSRLCAAIHQDMKSILQSAVEIEEWMKLRAKSSS